MSGGFAVAGGRPTRACTRHAPLAALAPRAAEAPFVSRLSARILLTFSSLDL